MGPQRQKTSKPRGRIEYSENQMQISEPSKSNANKVCFQKNKRALDDLTNKAVTTPMKSMGNASDKEDEPGSDFQQSIKKPSDRQTRSKAKSILSSIPIDDCKRQTNSKNLNLSKTSTKTEHPVAHPNAVNPVSVGMNLSNSLECSRKTRQSVKESTSSSLHSLLPANRDLVAILSPAKVPNIKAMHDPEQSKDFSAISEGALPTGVQELNSKPKMVEAAQPFRQTRNMAKTQNMSTLNNSDVPKEVSPRSSAKDAKAGSLKTLLCPTESQVIKSDEIENSKIPPSRKKGIASVKVPLAKRKTALEKWIEQAAEVSLVDGSSPRTCRKSARLSISKLSSTNLASSKSDSKVTSPRSATKRTLVAKKVPVWKTEPKPERLHSAPDDVYGFEYDASECKPAKKKRTRKPKKEDDVYKARKVMMAPKPTKRLPRTAIGDTIEDAEKSSMRSKIGTKPFKADKNTKDTTPLLNAVAEKLKKLTDHIDESDKEVDLGDVSHIYPIVEQSVSVCDVTFPENANAEILSDIKDKPNESGVLAGDLEETGQVIPSNISQAEATLENLFGFEDAENESLVCATVKTVEKQLVKSTPIKQRTIAECFASMSPVRKVTKATRKSVNRPARIDEHVARDLIRGIRPLHPAIDKEKSTSLIQYIKDVAEEEVPDENSDSMINVPPTPPSVFTQPPRRSYSKRELRTVKRTIFQDDDDKELEPSDEEEAAPKKSKKRVGGKTVHKRNKRDEEEQQWCKVMNSHFEDVEKFNLSS